MSNKKQLDLSLSSLFGFYLIAQVLTMFVGDGDSVSALKTKSLLGGIFLFLAALPMAYLSYRNEAFKKSVGRIGAILAACMLILEAINRFHIYSHPFSGLLFGENSTVFFLVVSFMLGLGGILFFVDSKASKGIKIFGVILFIAEIARGYVAFLVRERVLEVYDFDTYIDKVANLYFILGIIQILAILLNIVAFILAIVSSCKSVDVEDTDEWQDERIAVEDFATNKYEVYEKIEREEVNVIEKSEEKPRKGGSESSFVASSFSDYSSKVYLCLLLLGLFGFFTLLAYFVNSFLIEPLTLRYGDSSSYRSYDSSFPVVVAVLMFLATIVTLVVSCKSDLFKKSVGQVFGIFAALVMGITSYIIMCIANRTRVHMEEDVVLVCFILLGIFALGYFAYVNIYEGRLIKLFGYASLISYVAFLALMYLIYLELSSSTGSYYRLSSSSVDYVKDLVGVLKFCGIFFYITSIISLIASVFVLFRPMPKVPDEYRL